MCIRDRAQLEVIYGHLAEVMLSMPTTSIFLKTKEPNAGAVSYTHLDVYKRQQTTFSDTEAEIAEAVDFVVHVERQPGRRIVREVLGLRGYDRDAKRFLIEPVFEVKHVAV